MISGGSINGNVVAAERAVDGILRALDNSRNLKGTVWQTDLLHLENGDISWAYMDSVGKTNDLNGFIEIEEVRSAAPRGGTIGAHVEGRSSSKLHGTAFINFYVIDGRIPNSNSSSIIDILSDMQRKREYYRALGFELGNYAGRLIYPNWVWFGRKYYNKGSREIKQAKPMIQKGNWGIAEKQLEIALENNGSRKAQGRAYYKLALVKEGQGEPDKAIEYAETAALQYGDKMANDYLVILRQRKRQVELIKQQREQ